MSTSDLGECNSVRNTHRYMYRIYISYSYVLPALPFRGVPAHISLWEGWQLVTFALNSRWEEEKANKKLKVIKEVKRGDGRKEGRKFGWMDGQMEGRKEGRGKIEFCLSLAGLPYNRISQTRWL